MSWLIGNALVASLLILVVLVLRRPVARLFGARAAYALWLAPALRLVLPPMPLPEASPIAAAASPATAYWTLVVVPAGERIAPLATMLLAIWATGALLMLGFHLAAHVRFLRNALAAGEPLMVDGVTVDIIATSAVDGPMATGLAHPLIFVPHDFEERFTPDQRRLALLHEQLHHARGDIWASAAALLAASILWFNPFTYVALGAFRRDMESACDASLLGSAGRAAAPAYAETILRCAARPVPRSLCALTSIDELKGRMIMITSNHGKLAKFAGLVLAGGLVAAGSIAVPAMAEEAKSTTQTTEIRKVIHNGPGQPGDPQAMMKSCPGQVIEVSADAAPNADRKEAARIKLCLKAGTKAETATRLEEVVADIDKNEMDAAVKADLKAKLTAKIAELRAGS